MSRPGPVWGRWGTAATGAVVVAFAVLAAQDAAAGAWWPDATFGIACVFLWGGILAGRLRAHRRPRPTPGDAVADNVAAQLYPGWFEVSPEARRYLSDEDLDKLRGYGNYTAEDVAEARRLYGGKIHDDGGG